MGPTAGRAPAAPRVAAAVSALRTRGERVTRVRQAVIEVLDATPEPRPPAAEPKDSLVGVGLVLPTAHGVPPAAGRPS